MSSSSRPRFDGTPEEIADALDMEKPGDIKYNNCIDPALLAVQASRLRKMKKLKDNLSFKRTSVQEALRIILSRHESWNLSEVGQAEFVAVVSARVMTMLRHVSQAECRDRPPKWYLNLWKGEGDTNPDPKVQAPGVSASSVGTQEEEAWFYGYSAELGSAWRCKPCSPGMKEYTSKFEEGAGELDPVQAVFDDGSTYVVHGLTTLAHKNSQGESSKQRSTNGSFFEGRTSSGAPVVVRFRSEGPNRPPLISLFLSGRQICQSTITDGVNKEVASDTMVKVAKAFVDNLVDKGGVYKLRDKLLEERGVNVRTTRKRTVEGDSKEEVSLPKPAEPAEVSAKEDVEVDVDVEPNEMSVKSANDSSLADLFGSESESDARNDMELPQTGFMDGFEF